MNTFRTTFVAIAALTVAGATALSPTAASAHAFGGGHFGGGHFGGGHFGGGHFGGGFVTGLGVGLGLDLLETAIAAAPQSCVQTQYVQLRNGLYRQVAVNVC